MNIGLFLSCAGMGLSLAALMLTFREKTKAMSDADLIKHGLWDECDGEPMNKYAEEFERRHGINERISK